VFSEALARGEVPFEKAVGDWQGAWSMRKFVIEIASAELIRPAELFFRNRLILVLVLRIP
jgi:hypothetical protein